MPKLRPEPGPPPGPNQEASTPTTASRLSEPQKLALIALRAHQSINRKLRSLEPALGPNAPKRGATPASQNGSRAAQVQAQSGADRSPTFRATVARKHDPDQENANTRQTEPDRNNRRQSPIANGTGVWRRPERAKAARRSVDKTVRQRRRLTWKCRSAAAQNRAFCETPRRFAPSSTALRAEAPLSRRCFKTTLVERGAAQTTQPTGFARAPVQLPIPPPPKPNPMNPAQT